MLNEVDALVYQTEKQIEEYENIARSRGLNWYLN